jgi:hypothetical protein
MKKFAKINDALFTALDKNDASLVKGGLLAATYISTKCGNTNTHSGASGEPDTMSDCPDFCPDNEPCPY